MVQTLADAAASPEIKTLEYGCSSWRMSSQKAADLYKAGVKLWTREDLKDIEEQLEKSYTTERFSVRRIDGSIIQIANPMFQVQNPIWKALVRYQEYWNLVRKQPIGSPELYLCPYIVDWTNRTAVEFQPLIPQPMQCFEEKELLWQNSITRKHLTTMIRDLLGTTTVRKVICFALGEMFRSAPDHVKESDKPWDEAKERKHKAKTMIQHSMAHTIAQVCCGDEPVPLLTQDPDYTAFTEEFLTKKGFKVVGTHGAGGFAEIDDESIVISAYPVVPVKQIIADIGRPALIICRREIAFNVNDEPYADPDSPRTMQMWLDHYDSYNLPIHYKDTQISIAWESIHLYHRRQQPLDSKRASEPEFTGCHIQEL